MTYTQLISSGELLTAAEVATLLGVGVKSVNAYVNHGVRKHGKRRTGEDARVYLAAIRIPGGLRFERAAVDRFLAELNGGVEPAERGAA